MNGNSKLTQLDNAQIVRRQFDENNDAQRVILVSGEMPKVTVEVDASAITKAIQAGLEGFKPSIIPAPTVTESPIIIDNIVEIPKIVTETRIERIEVPVIIKETVYKEIKVPFEVMKVVEIEKPVIVKEVQILTQSTAETKYLRILCVCLIIMEITTLLFYGRN